MKVRVGEPVEVAGLGLLQRIATYGPTCAKRLGLQPTAGQSRLRLTRPRSTPYQPELFDDERETPNGYQH